jgi:hypothetical protein
VVVMAAALDLAEIAWDEDPDRLFVEGELLVRQLDHVRSFFSFATFTPPRRRPSRSRAALQ